MAHSTMRLTPVVTHGAACSIWRTAGGVFDSSRRYSQSAPMAWTYRKIYRMLIQKTLNWNLDRNKSKTAIVRFDCWRSLTMRNMGSYHQAISLFEQGKTPTPDIDAHPQQTWLKYGFGLKLEQNFTQLLRG